MRAFYSVREFRAELKSRGIDVTDKAIRHYIERGTLKAQKDVLRPSRWLIPSSELERVAPLAQQAA
ncbi:hypothetical protein K3G39_18205 [Pontibacter sp. HSC-14F20]|uniref:hypothetical protein n=1 Tax=Pontibacter sp. HSC-14F20 TaxID=2864136 RepID=UPI001C72F30C|nr:hypothetical protein [Pontibacter sp. HSC-14F20]MBX0335172.1 hypothetical protein [Pontibacter sp. HSC-14F20]